MPPAHAPLTVLVTDTVGNLEVSAIAARDIADVSACIAAKHATAVAGWTAGTGCEQYVPPHKGPGALRAWTPTGWARVRRVLRRKTDRCVMRVIVGGGGVVDVMEDRFLMRADGRRVLPAQLRAGDALMQSVPLTRGFHIAPPMNARKERFHAYAYTDDSGIVRIVAASQVAAQAMGLRFAAKGYTFDATAEPTVDADFISLAMVPSTACPPPEGRVVRVERILAPGVEYELETEAGVYAAGVGHVVLPLNKF